MLLRRRRSVLSLIMSHNSSSRLGTIADPLLTHCGKAVDNGKIGLPYVRRQKASFQSSLN